MPTATTSSHHLSTMLFYFATVHFSSASDIIYLLYVYRSHLAFLSAITTAWLRLVRTRRGFHQQHGYRRSDGAKPIWQEAASRQLRMGRGWHLHGQSAVQPKENFGRTWPRQLNARAEYHHAHF